MQKNISIEQHNIEIQENLKRWNEKPLLRMVYRDLFNKMLPFVLDDKSGRTVELGSGIGQIKEILPHCITTDMFSNPRIDRVESVYKLSFADNEVTNVIMFHVFHHLRYPGTALRELYRVIKPGGRIILFDPYISLLGRLVYGPLHHEPIAMRDGIVWDAPDGFSPGDDSYYAAQGNATRIFHKGEYKDKLSGWNIVARERYSALAYIFSGGYSKPQMYPTGLLGVIKGVERMCDIIPAIFATCILVVLEKTDE